MARVRVIGNDRRQACGDGTRRLGFVAALTALLLAVASLAVAAPARSADFARATRTGTSPAVAADRFSYQGPDVELPPENVPPEFGRCVKVPAGTGVYGGSNCTAPGGTKSFVWRGLGVMRGFTGTLAGGTAFVLETTRGTKVFCTGASYAGEYLEPKRVGNLIETWTGCSSGSLRCSSVGRAAGEVVTNPLEGSLGVIAKGSVPTKNKIGLRVLPVSGDDADFACGGLPFTVRGAVIHQVTIDKMLTVSSEKYVQGKGKQKPERFEGGVKEVLELNINGGPFEQTGLSLTATQTNSEAIEVNAVV
jgi:hypothetical protein